MNKTIIIVGMGAGLSWGIAEKFGRAGYRVGMVSRNAERLAHFAAQLTDLGVTAAFAPADAGNTEQLNAALHTLLAQLGDPDVLLYNAVDYRMKPVLEETNDDLANGFRVSVGNALEAVKTLRPALRRTGGCVLLTGGGSANYPNPDMASISLGKAGLKNLAYQLHAALKNEGVYVGTVTVSGWIQPDSPTHSPRLLAEKFWQLAQQRTPVELVY